MTSVSQPPLPLADTARFEADVWRAFVDAWGDLEAAHVVPHSVLVPETAFRCTLCTWVVASVNGRTWSGHGDDAKDAAAFVFREVHGGGR